MGPLKGSYFYGKGELLSPESHKKGRVSILRGLSHPDDSSSPATPIIYLRYWFDQVQSRAPGDKVA